MEYKDAAEIDKNNLDEEAVKAPALFDEFARRYAAAKAKHEALKNQMKVLQADVSLKVRGWTLEQINSFFVLALPKVSEDVFKQLALIHPDVVNLYNQINEASNEMEIFNAGKDTMDKKIFMLNNLKDLHGQGYFAKIEGGAGFRQIKLNFAIEQLNKMVADRVRKEGQPFTEKPKAPTSTTKTLKERVR